MRIHYSVKHWFNFACILVLLPFSNLALSNYTKLDPAAALALIDAEWPCGDTGYLYQYRC